MPFFPQFSNLFVAPYVPTPTITPADISGLTVWLRADEGVTVTDGEATGWTDQSGNSNTPSLDEFGTGNPEYKATGVNGLPCVYFNNTKCFVYEGINLDNWTVIHVAKIYYDEDGLGRVFCNTRFFGDAANILVGSWSNYQNRMYVQEWVYQGTSQDYAWKITTGLCSTDNDESYFYQNGVLLGGPVETSASLNDYAVGGGWEEANPERSVADVAEVIIYNRVITPEERQGIETYLNNKYAIY